MEDLESSPLASGESPRYARTAGELARKIFASKARRRDWLASLPVEEKYQRFLQLQRMVWETRRAAGKPCPLPWPDDLVR